VTAKHPIIAIQTVRGSFQFSFVNFFTCGCYGCNILIFLKRRHIVNCCESRTIVNPYTFLIYLILFSIFHLLSIYRRTSLLDSDEGMFQILKKDKDIFFVSSLSSSLSLSEKDNDNQATNVSTYDEMNISYDGNMSCDGETPNHINSNSTWIFLHVVVTVATYLFF